MISIWAFLGVLGFRISNSILLNTYFDPDEFWQWYEPALYLMIRTFQNSRQLLPEPYLTWEWREGIRSWFFPSILAILWRFFNEPSYWLLVARVFTGTLSAFIDFGTLCVTRKYYESDSVMRNALILTLSSWFNWCFVNRGLSNQLETLFVVWGLYFWPRKSTGNWAAVGLFLALAFMIRPTALVPFGLPVLFCLWRMRWTRKLVVALALSLFLMLAVVVQIYLDSLLAESVHFSSWRFLKVNVLKGVSVRYGTNFAIYYLVVSLPAMFTTGLIDLWSGWRLEGASLIGKLFALGPLFVYSLLAHKEIRFVMPLMPIGLTLMARTITKRRLYLFAAVNVMLSAYFGFVHQRGPMMAAAYLSKYPSDANVLILMPCHSMPHQGYILNSRLQIDFITCEPNLNSPASTKDETDIVYSNYPRNYYKRAEKQAYDLILTFGDASFEGYEPVQKYFNGFYNPDWRRRGQVIIHKKLK